MRLDALVGQPKFDQLPARVQTRVINGMIESSPRAAGELVKMQNPSLIGQAMQARQDMLVNGRTGR